MVLFEFPIKISLYDKNIYVISKKPLLNINIILIYILVLFSELIPKNWVKL
jgi:hypothetical protein